MVNIAEILRYAPQGLKLYSVVHGEVTLKSVDISIHEMYPIEIIAHNEVSDSFSKDGKIFYDYNDAECVLFPSKEHKSWDNWQEVLFKVGDIVTNIKSTKKEQKTFIISSKSLNLIGITNSKNELLLQEEPSSYRYATPEEREQFFDELNNNGYYWNDNTKQIETSLQQDKHKDSLGGDSTWNKEESFTIDDFKPTQFVLCRDWNDQEWNLDVYSRRDANDNYVCIHATWARCIPYNDETKHLLGTTDDCPDKYKTW